MTVARIDGVEMVRCNFAFQPLPLKGERFCERVIKNGAEAILCYFFIALKKLFGFAYKNLSRIKVYIASQ